MQKVLKWIKKNKKLVKIFVTVFVILLLAILIYVSIKSMWNYLSPSSKKSVYGDRCDDVSNLPLTDDEIKDVEDLINGKEQFSVVEINNNCKLIDIVINIDVDTDFETVNNLGKEILTVIPSAIVDKYDIQLFVKSSNKEDANYPKIGTHHKYICVDEEDEEDCKRSDSFVW